MSRLAAFFLLVTACAPRPSTITQRYPDGQIRAEFSAIDGRPHGSFKSRHRNGTTESRGQYKEGVRHGVFYRFDEDGRVTRTTFFFEGRELWSAEGKHVVPERFQLMLATKAAEEKSAAELARVYAPEFLVGDLVGPVSSTKARVEAIFVDDTSEGTVFRLRAQSQYYVGKVGAYLAASTGSPGSGSKTVLEAGGALNVPYGPFEAIVSSGIFFPLAGDNFEGYLNDREASAVPSAYRAYYLPQVYGFRNTLSLTTRSTKTFFRAEGGVDFAVRRPGNSQPRIESNQVMVRGSVEAGVALARLQATAGLGYSTGVSGVLDAPFVFQLSVQVPREKYNVFLGVATPVSGEFAGAAIGFLVGSSLRH